MFTDYGTPCDTRGADVSTRAPPVHPPALIHYLHQEIHQKSLDRWEQMGAHVGVYIVYMSFKRGHRTIRHKNNHRKHPNDLDEAEINT